MLNYNRRAMGYVLNEVWGYFGDTYGRNPKEIGQNTPYDKLEKIQPPR
ncbi:MAG: hypothetical protein Q8907_09995 [Bacteroidota bacterium]|nr:hypothetical protein [Bacteroidota bacterium]